jgi:hypothetical protein
MNSNTNVNLKAYFFAGGLREPEVIIIATNPLTAKAEFFRLSGKVKEPRRERSVLIAEPDVVTEQRVEELGETPTRMYQVNDENEFPLLFYFGGDIPDVDNDEPALWDTLVLHVNEGVPWLFLEDGNDLRQKLIAEMNRWERKYKP